MRRQENPCIRWEWPATRIFEEFLAEYGRCGVDRGVTRKTATEPPVPLPRPNGKNNAIVSYLTRWLFSPLQGATDRAWREATSRPGHRVAPEYLPRAAMTAALTRSNGARARREDARYDTAVGETAVTAPLFVLGHYRGGTTFLHDLLSADPRMAAPNYYQVSFPNTFLTTEDAGARMAGPFTLDRRPQDNVAMGLDRPAEDELALCADTLLSPHMCWHFPEREAEYRRFVTFRDADDDERERWKSSLVSFARKLTYKTGRTVVLKSPCHTARIPLILEAFPDARFVHLHRHPYRVFQSTVHMEHKVGPLFQFQRRDPDSIEEFVLWRYREMYDAYLVDREVIPANRLFEVSYEDLTGDPLGTLAALYAALDLPSFADAREAIAAYLAGLGAYRTNSYVELDPAVRRRVRDSWSASFDEWGYGNGVR